MSTAVLVRVISSPPLSLPIIDDLRRRFSSSGQLLVCTSDADLNVFVLSFQTDFSGLNAALSAVFEKVGAAGSSGRAFRLDLQTETASDLSDDAIRSIAVDAHGALRAPVHVARRSVPPAAWKDLRAMGWGPDGLGLPLNAATLPYSPTDSPGVAIEIGAPTIVLKVQLAGAGGDEAQRILDAVGGQESGFSEVAAYLISCQRQERCFAVIEIGDVRRTPPARVLQVLQTEARRYGASLAAGAVLSHLPLSVVLDTLWLKTGLTAQAGQVIETHLKAGNAQVAAS